MVRTPPPHRPARPPPPAVPLTPIVCPITQIVLDTEGIDAYDQTGRYSTQIFALAVLLSQTLIFNQIGGIDESAVDRLALVAERERLTELLSTEIDWLTPYPSSANFVLCSVGGGKDAGEIRDRLAKEHGIMVRHYAKKELSGFVRISVGKPEHTDRLIEALRRL